MYAVALHDTVRASQAIEVLSRAVARHPYDRETLGALAMYLRGAGRAPEALGYARRLAELDPTNAELRQVVQRLEQESQRRRP